MEIYEPQRLEGFQVATFNATSLDIRETNRVFISPDHKGPRLFLRGGDVKGVG